MRIIPRHFVLVLKIVLLAGAMNLTVFGETLQFSVVFTLRDNGNDGTVDEIADTPPVIGVPSIWGSVDRVPGMTSRTFMEFGVQNTRLASRAILNLTISNSGTAFGAAQVKLGIYPGAGSTNLSRFTNPGSFLASLEVPLASSGTFCCNLQVDVTNVYNGFIASGTPFLGFSLYDPQWAADPSKGQVSFADASLEITSTNGVPVTIDIRIGSNKNKINPKSNGILSVAILSTEQFDATRVDERSIRFGSAQARTSPVHAVIADVNQDGKLDLVLYFHTQEMTIQCRDEFAVLIGQTLDGTLIAGSDRIETIGCKGN
jgi:hypothetical protein